MGEYGKHEAEGENKVALAIAEIKKSASIEISFTL